tara:strand:+ start:1 stop:1254 length:1254 start_codon:yes stop_codon:yes gene_type:complete
MPMTSDQVVWSEQNRLHVAYDDCAVANAGADITVNIPGGTGTSTLAIRQNQTILVSNGILSVPCFVDVDTSALTGAAITFSVEPYTSTDLVAAGFGATEAVKLFVYGSEFAKGTNGMNGAIEPEFTQYNNKPIIIKDKYEVSGSDAAQIGWVEVATEDGTTGYFWYLKAESETRLRFEDYLEMAMVESERATNAALTGANIEGSEGMFAAIENRGNVYNDFAGAAAPGGSGSMADFDDILKHLDKQGAIEENMLFLSRRTALDFDDMIGAMAGGGYASAQAASYGLFDNEAEMALNFGFSGFRRGSYDFYKTDWKYLNDASTRGLTEDIDGVLVPAGTSTVYDQILGSNIRRPFLHVRYRASQADDRRMKSWITGSVGGAYTSDLDAMEVHFLSERCLCVQAANNFVLFKSTVLPSP